MEYWVYILGNVALGILIAGIARINGLRAETKEYREIIIYSFFLISVIVITLDLVTAKMNTLSALNGFAVILVYILTGMITLTFPLPGRKKIKLYRRV